MKCPSCSTLNRDEARFCRHCGVKLQGVSASIEWPRAAADRFCDVCGGALAREPDPRVPHHALRDGTLNIEAITAGPVSSERKQVTVLFADICNSTELISGRDPEDARPILDPIIQLMIDAVHNYGGLISQIRGDGILALFGAPRHQEDHALRSCYAALHLQQQLRRTAERSATAEAAVQVRIGINSGEVVVGTVASDLSSDYTAAGEIIHIAARLQEMASPGVTLCASDTVKLVRELVEVVDRGVMELRGVKQPVGVMELTGARAVRRRFPVSVDRGLTPFIGREQEARLLAQCLERAQHGNSQVVGLVGDAGVGKSRLIWEVLRSRMPEGWQVVEAGAFSYARNIPYFAIIPLVRTICGIDDKEGPAEARERISGTLDSIGGFSALSRAAVSALLGLDSDDAEWQALEPPERRRQTTETFVQLVFGYCAEKATVIVVEDLHWIDNESYGALSALVSALQTQRLALFVNFRPEFEPSWFIGPHYTEVKISPLSQSVSQSISDALLGSNSTIADLKQELIVRTGGNPFFLEETIRGLIESRVIEDREGAFVLANAAAASRVPATVQAVLGERIDRLDPQDKEMLQAASALGGSFSLDVLHALLAGKSPERVLASLGRLKDCGLLYESSLYPDIEYSFRHALTQEVAYNGMLQERRRRLHAEIVLAMETVYASRIGEIVETLAYHAVRGEAWHKADGYAFQAGQKSALQSAYKEAVVFFEDALGALARLPQDGERLKRSIDVRFELRNSLLPLGMVARDLEHLRRAEELARELGDAHRLAWSSAYAARDLSLLGRPDNALQAGLHAQELAVDLDDVNLQMLVQAYLGQANYALGKYRASASIMEGCVSRIPADHLAERYGLPGSGAVFFRAWWVWPLARLGESGKAIKAAREMLQLAEATHQPLCQTVAHYSHGFLYVIKGDFDRATAILEHSLDMCRSWHFPAWFPNIASALGYAYAQSGRIDTGLDLLHQAVDRTRSLGIMVNHANEVAWLAEATMLAGQLGEATRIAREALELSRQYRERGHEAEVLRLLGEIAMRRSRDDTAASRAYYLQAIDLAAKHDMKPTIARCQLGLGSLLQSIGETEASLEYLEKARSVFREADMDSFGRRTERRLHSLVST